MSRVKEGNEEEEKEKGIGRREEKMKKNEFIEGMGKNVIKGEKIGIVLKNGDKRKLIVDKKLKIWRDNVRKVMEKRKLKEEVIKMLMGCIEGRDGLVGIGIFKIIKMEGDGREEIGGRWNGLRIIEEKEKNIMRRFKVELGIILKKKKGGKKGSVMESGSKKVMKREEVRVMIEKIIGGDKRKEWMRGKKGDELREE